MKTTKILIFGLAFAAVSLALFASPVFVQKAKANILDVSMMDNPGPFQRGKDHIGGAYGHYDSDGNWVIEYLYYTIDSTESPLSGDGHLITTYWWSS